MSEAQRFGSTTHRSYSGALLSGEIERIKGFLRSRGLLLAEFLDGHLVISFPSVTDEVKGPLIDTGFQEVVLGASLDRLRQVTDLAVAEIRVLEALSPGPLIIMRSTSETSKMPPVTIPDNLDLRDIASALGGAMTAFMRPGGDGRGLLENALCTPAHELHTRAQLGTLETSWSGGAARSRATVVRIIGPRAVECIAEGVLALAKVEEASAHMSQWEIEDWT